MDIKGQQVEHEKDHGQVALSVTEVVLNVIALVFQGVESFVFDFPPCPAAFNHGNHIIFINMNIGNSAIFIVDFAGFRYDPVLKEVDKVSIFCAV